MTTQAIPLSITGGRYGEVLRGVIEKLLTQKNQEITVRLLDTLVASVSEHTLSLMIRSLRQRPAPSPREEIPCETAVRFTANKLAARDDAQDETAARILHLLADLVCEPQLEQALAMMEPRPKVDRTFGRIG